MTAPPIVEVHQELSPLLPGFLANRQRDRLALHAALESRDWPAIQRIGHNLKGAGGGYGFHEISRIGEALEAAASLADQAALQRLSADYMAYLRDMQVVFVET